jgi:hypothetical protein
MPVAARVVGDADQPTVCAVLDMATECRCSTELYGAHDAPLGQAKVPRMRLTIGLSMAAEDLRHLQAGRKPASDHTESPAEENPSADDAAIPFSAKLAARVGSRQTLVTGGWSTAPGRRTVVLMTPVVNIGDNGDKQVVIQSLVIEGSESALAQAGFAEVKSDLRESSFQRVFTETEAQEAMKSLEGSGDVHVLSAPTISTAEGRQVQVSINSTGADGPALASSFDLVPRVTADGGAIDLEIDAQLTQPKAAKPSSR